MAVDAATLAAKISVEGADRAKRELTGFSGAVEKNAQQLRKIGIGLTAVGATITGIGGIALKMAMDVTESENLFDVAMGDMGASAREFSIRLRDELGLNEFKIRENIGVLFQMTSAMGISRDSAFQMATGLTELSQDMASFFNLKPEEAFLKIQSGIVGEIEPLRRLGILVDETTTKNALMTAGLIEQGDELSQQQKVIGRYLAILEQTTNAQGDLARTIDSPINQLRVLRSQIEALLITIGNQLIPRHAVNPEIHRSGPGSWRVGQGAPWPYQIYRYRDRGDRSVCPGPRPDPYHASGPGSPRAYSGGGHVHDGWRVRPPSCCHQSGWPGYSGPGRGLRHEPGQYAG